ncbi:hypothetical protein LTR66_017718 [Elasticomyces elasticus]|nr:hypothetical protein LTR66_017718 [Elasticomyces elasticus]
MAAVWSESTISDFVESKISEFEIEKWYMSQRVRALEIMRHSGKLTTADFLKKAHNVIEKYRTASTNFRLLKGRRIMIQETIFEKDNAARMRIGPAWGLVSQSYMSGIMLDVIDTTKRADMKFDLKAFKKRVTEHYDLPTLLGRSGQTGSKLSGFCHIQGEFRQWSDIKAAHIVPRFLSEPEISHLLGNIDADEAKEPSNALSIARTLEPLLDRGIIAIVPVFSAHYGSSRWKCIVLQDTYRDTIIDVYRDERGTVQRKQIKDFDEMELHFLSAKRPRPRYLYLRFMLSYLNAKRLGLDNVVHRMENGKFWAPGGRYLRKAILNTIARLVCGTELPEELTNNCFDTTHNEAMNLQDGMILAADIRDMMISQDKTKSEFDRRLLS